MSLRLRLGASSFSLWALVSCSSGDSNTPNTSSGGENHVTSGGQSSSSTAGKQATGGNANVAGAAGSSSPTSGGTAGEPGGVAGKSNDAGSAGSPANTGGAASGEITCRAAGDGKSTITMVNNCTDNLSFRGSGIDGGELKPGEHACRDIGSSTESIPAIRFWGFIGEDPGGERYTLAELTLNTDFNDFDWYNISHVDAHNLPMQVVPVDMAKCRTLTCAKSLLADCPAEGQLEDSNGKLISCFNPHRDDKNSVVALYFEAGCADAYSWSGDDQNSVAACAGEDYDVIFCP